MTCQACDVSFNSCSMTHVQDHEGEWRKRIHSSKDCPGCGVAQGGIHHAECPEEPCPICKGKFATCNCLPALITLGAA